MAVLAAGGACPAGEETTAARARALAARLAADDGAEREAARTGLLLLGAEAIPALEEAAKGKEEEARQSAEDLLGKLRPLAELKSADRRRRIAAAEAANELAEELLAGGHPAGALARYREALQADLDLLDSEHVRDRLTELAGKLPDAARADFRRSDLGLYVAEKFDDLRREHPRSPLAGKALYGQGGFEEYLRGFPDGFYAPHSRYCLIAGRKAYRTPNRKPKPLTIADPDREIRDWPQFLKDHPDFDGADDANYRLARALETRGRLQEACLRLRLRLPDGDLDWNARERLLFIMDSAMDAKSLADLRAALARDPQPAEKLLLSDPELTALTLYLEALKLLREGRHREAAEAFGKVPKLPEAGKKVGAPAAEVGEDEDENENEDENEGDEGNEDDGPGQPLAALAELAAARAEFAAAAAKLLEAPDAGKLRDLAELFRSEKSRFAFMTGLDWGGGLALSSYETAAGPAEFHQRRSRFWQAAQVCERLIREHPKTPAAADAMFMLAECHCRLAETHWPEHRSVYWRKNEKENVKKSIDWYVRFARENPDDPRFAKARNISEALTEAWFRGPRARSQDGARE